MEDVPEEHEQVLPGSFEGDVLDWSVDNDDEFGNYFSDDEDFEIPEDGIIDKFSGYLNNTLVVLPGESSRKLLEASELLFEDYFESYSDFEFELYDDNYAYNSDFDRVFTDRFGILLW